MSARVLFALPNNNMDPQTPNNALEPVKPERSLDQGMTPSDLKKAVKEEEARRKIIKDYIKRNMTKGIDYDVITMKTRDGRSVDTKPTLLKPGSEKFCSLMHLTPRMQRDDETWEMSGNKAGLFAYVCQLFSATGQVIGEGRGAANMTEKGWTENNAIKIAMKRAQMDAVLRTGGLSEFFTQDLEDIKNQVQKPKYQVPKPDPAILQSIVREAEHKGISPIEAAKILSQRFGARKLQDLNRVQASQFLDILIKLPSPSSPAATMKKPDDDLDIEEVSRAIG